MAKALSAKQAAQRMRDSQSFLMLTYEASGASYSLDSGHGVTGKAARELIATGECNAPRQADLFVVANEDGLFPGFSQTWRNLA